MRMELLQLRAKFGSAQDNVTVAEAELRAASAEFLRALWASDKTLEDIAEEFDIDVSTVKRRALALGLEKRGQRPAAGQRRYMVRRSVTMSVIRNRERGAE